MIMINNLVTNNTIKITIESKQPLCFTARQANSTVVLNGGYYYPELHLECRVNNGTWTAYYIGTLIELPSIGDKVFFRASQENETFSSAIGGYTFAMTGQIEASGNIQTLLKADGSRIDAPPYCYAYLFYDCTALTRAPMLPATQLGENCYSYMFYDCTSLVTTPSLPKVYLQEGCCIGMFTNCTSLTEMTQIKTSHLDRRCCAYMLQNCISLEGNANVEISQMDSIPDEAFYQMLHNCQNIDNTMLYFSDEFDDVPVLSSTSAIAVFDNSEDDAQDRRLSIHVPTSLVDAWKQASGWDIFAERIS